MPSYFVRPLCDAEKQEILSFLQSVSAESYIIRSNIQVAGLINEGKPFQADYYGVFGDNVLLGVIAHTTANALLVAGSEKESFSVLSSYVKEKIVNKGGNVRAIIGSSVYASCLINVLAIPQTAFARNEQELLMELSGSPTIPDDTKVVVQLLDEAHFEDATTFWVDYNVEVKGFPRKSETYEAAQKELKSRQQSCEIFILLKDGIMSSICGISRTLEDSLLVGPVWTPHSARNKGYGKMVCAHAIHHCLKELPPATKALLYTANPIAEKLYRSIGFQPVGSWTFALMPNDYKIL